MNEEQIIKRATTNGTKSAKAMYYRDYSLSKSYHNDTVNLKRYYPELSDKIQAAYDEAYKTEWNQYDHRSRAY